MQIFYSGPHFSVDVQKVSRGVSREAEPRAPIAPEAERLHEKDRPVVFRRRDCWNSNRR